jgi:4-amino-4-deoxy-L-arabinose transferase-like glycosyltransferase
MGKRNLILLILIVILGAVLRFAFLTQNPPSLNWDEVSHGYNAYSILKTGMDQWGQKLPIFNFRAYGDYPTTLNLYLTIPFIAIFGLTSFAIRFPHAILGTLMILSVYFLTFGITKKKNLSLLAAFLTAIGPWYVFTSRFVLQSNLSVFFLTTAAALFVNRGKNKSLIYLSFFSLFLTLFSYHTTRIFSPLIVVGALLIYKREIGNKLVYVFIALFLALSAYILISPNATARGNVLFLIDQGAINKIDMERTSSKLPSTISKIIYNRPVYFVENFSRNYFSYFTPQFLFLKGGTQYQFSIPDTGLIYPVSLSFFYFGLVLLVLWSFKTPPFGSKNDYRLMLFWLILSPIPAALTNESYTVIRATTMLPIPEILTAIGFFSLVNWKIWSSHKINLGWLMPLYIFILLLSTGAYITKYFTSYRENYSWSWQYGYSEVVDYVKANYNSYDKIIVTKKYGEPHEYFLFFLKYNPAKYLSDSGKITFFQSNWYWVDHFDKFWFVNDWQIPKTGNNFVLESKGTVTCPSAAVRCLLITSPNNFPAGWRKIKTINFLDGSPAFEMYENR